MPKLSSKAFFVLFVVVVVKMNQGSDRRHADGCALHLGAAAERPPGIQTSSQTLSRALSVEAEPARNTPGKWLRGRNISKLFS